MVASKLKQSLAILIHSAYSKMFDAKGPRFMICTHFGTEVAQDDKFFLNEDRSHPLRLMYWAVSGSAP